MANASIAATRTRKHQRNADKVQTLAVTAEERTLLEMYRELSRWEKNGLFLVLQSLAWGQLNGDQTDKLSWPQFRKEIGLGRAVRHG